MQPLGHDPEYYDNGPGSERAKRDALRGMHEARREMTEPGRNHSMEVYMQCPFCDGDLESYALARQVICQGDCKRHIGNHQLSLVCSDEDCQNRATHFLTIRLPPNPEHPTTDGKGPKQFWSVCQEHLVEYRLSKCELEEIRVIPPDVTKIGKPLIPQTPKRPPHSTGRRVVRKSEPMAG